MNKIIGISFALLTLAICGLTFFYTYKEATKTPTIKIFTVTTTAASSDLLPGDGFCLDDVGECSLQALIEEANSTPGYYDFKLSIVASQLLLNDRPELLPEIADDTMIIGLNAGYPVIEGSTFMRTLSTVSHELKLAEPINLLYLFSLVSYPGLILLLLMHTTKQKSRTTQLATAALSGVCFSLFALGFVLTVIAATDSPTVTHLLALILYLVQIIIYLRIKLYLRH
jgi:hypothetical protein